MYYLVDRETKEHIRIPEDRLWMLVEYRKYHDLVQADADGWIGCDGEDRPIDGNQEIQWKGSNGFVSGVIPANCVFWGENGADKITAYRPIINTKEKEMIQEWKPEAGAKAQTSSGECEILAVDNERGKVSVRWNDGELGKVRIACVKPLPTERDRWIEAASIAAHKDAQLSPSQARIAAEYIYDAGLAKLPEQSK